jgi:hypothetical protein
MTIKRYSLLGLLMASVLLTACQKDTPAIKPAQIIKKYQQDTVLDGAVSGKSAAIKIGVIKASNLSGKVIAQTQLNNSNRYSLTIPANTPLPIILEFYPDAADKINTDKLIAVVIHDSITHYDISSLSNSIAQTAQALGGYTHTNMVRAAEDTVHVPDANKTSTGFRGDPTKQYGGWH